MLRVIRPDEVPERTVQDAYAACLSDEESTRIARFVRENDRRDRTIARGALRHALAGHAPGFAPAAFRFDCNRFGKPFIADPPECRHLRFNVSHCDGLIAIAVEEDTDVGIDVERIRPMPDLLAIAQRFFAAPEVDDLRALPESARLERFFQYWTLKESYIKARGQGLSLGLDRFWFELGDSPRIRFAQDFDDDPARWTFSQQRLEPCFWLAIATARQGTIEIAAPGPQGCHEPLPPSP